MHEFFGNGTTDQSSTVESLLAGSTNCARATDKSAYWVPRITWGGQEVLPERTGAYYGTRTGLRPAGTTTTPVGFKVIAYSHATTARADGEPLARRARARIDWHCNKIRSVDESMRVGGPIPPTSCDIKTLGVTVTFPECWDGEDWNVRGGANMRHSLIVGGHRRCPSGFPYYIPRLQMLVDYNLPTVDGPLKVLGHNGEVHDPSFFHADYLNAEDQKDLIRVCIRGGRFYTADICKQ